MKKDLRFEDYFIFSQNSLNTFKNCPLKFKKRYLDNLKWNSIPAPEFAELLEKGRNFHLMAQRYFSGIDCHEGADGDIDIWVENLKKDFPINKDFTYLPEYSLRIHQGNLRLEANYDLIIIKPENKVEIWDWKTHLAGRKSRGKNLKNSMESSFQTKVYMYVLKELCNSVTGHEVESSDISMSYWCPSPAQMICSVNYSDEIHEENKKFLSKKIDEILSYDYGKFNKNTYKEHCPQCEFSLLCNNARPSFEVGEEGIEDFMDEIDLDSVAERC